MSKNQVTEDTHPDLTTAQRSEANSLEKRLERVEDEVFADDKKSSVSTSTKKGS